jgi:hypothetical protein
MALHQDFTPLVEISPSAALHLFWPVSGLTSITISPSHAQSTVVLQMACSFIEHDKIKPHLYTAAGAAHFCLNFLSNFGIVFPV